MLLTLLLLYTTTPAQSRHRRLQNDRVTLTANLIKIHDVFKAIKKQTGFSVLYGNEMLNDQEKISVALKDVTAMDAVAYVLRGKNLTSRYADNNREHKIIIVAKIPSVNHAPGGAAIKPQPDTVLVFPVFTGKVTDAAGSPVAGATVLVKGTGQGASTDADGKFELHNVKMNNIITVSSIGYETREFPVTGHSILIPLNLDIQNLDETVVIAYGTTTKRFNTGNVSTVKGDDIEKQPVSNPLAALQGRVPGMIITQNTGAPGGSFTVQIRGQNSIANGNDPLYVIDGVPYTSQLLPNNIAGNIIGGGNPLNYINPADIESIDILKDADATAIYGSRGANGVVLITTKRGKPGKTQIVLDTYIGVGEVSRTMKMLNTQQYLQMRWEAFKNDGVTPQPWDYDVNGTWDTTRNTDWQKELIGGTAKYTDIRMNISGGNTNTQYKIGGAYHKETTVFPGDFADKKGSVNFSIINTSPNQKFKATLSGIYVSDYNELPNIDLVYDALNLPPNAPPGYNSDGSLNWANNTWYNPYRITLRKYKSNTNNLVSNALLSYELLPGLEVKASLGYTNMQVNEINTYPQASILPASGEKSNSYFTNNSIRSWIIEPQVSYNLKIKKSKLNILVGTTFQQNINEGQMLYATEFTSDALLENIQASSNISPYLVTNVRYKYNAVFGRINYNWLDKYLINLTARRDGSSRFGPGRQFSNFGAVGAAWLFHNERFFKSASNVLSFGKLRFSYGATGNDQIGDYKFMDLYNSTTYPYQSVRGLFANNLFNPDFAWEVNKKLEGGLELGLLRDRFLFSASYYRNRSSNQLLQYSLPTITGFNSVTANLPATVQNTGIEITLNTNNIKTKNFIWTTSINMTIPRNKLIAYPNLASSPYSLAYLIGQPLSIIQAYHLIGVNDTTGQYEFADNKGNPTYNPDLITDRTVIINTAPKFFGGFQNSFQFKGLQLDILFQYVKQVGLNNLYNFLPGFMGYNQPIEVLNRWKSLGNKSNIQRFNQDYSLGNAYNYARNSDQAYSDASFIRLKNLSLSYQLPTKWKQKLHLQDSRIYFRGQNLLTFTQYKGMDPENQSSNNLPPLRVFTAGIQITL